MHSLIADFLAHGPVVTDGAWGTQLQARGSSDFSVRDGPSRRSARDPDIPKGERRNRCAGSVSRVGVARGRRIPIRSK